VRIFEPIFEVTVHVVVGDLVALQRAEKRILDVSIYKYKPGGCCRWTYYEDTELPGSTFLIYIDAKQPKAEREDVRLHEVSHLVDRIFQRNNVPPGVESTELRARLLSFFVRKIKV